MQIRLVIFYLLMKTGVCGLCCKYLECSEYVLFEVSLYITSNKITGFYFGFWSL
jgi:hypothetical protein